MRQVPTPLGKVRKWWQQTFGNGTNDEKRHTPRSPFSGWVEITTSAGGYTRGLARDLSVRGIGSIVSADFRVGESVLIKYTHPLAADRIRELSRRATVRSRYGSRYGFEFEKPIEFWAAAAARRD